MSNFRGLAVAGLSGAAVIAAALAGTAPAAATAPAARTAAGQIAVVDQSSPGAERGITRPWRYHSTHSQKTRCELTGQVLKSNGIATETQCRYAGATWRLFYR
ncbi:hypothetical protein [Jiangella alba]|uniref:Uncharacterized protein n=1 Tax=Jiangella alba TaxID=561176 RepID=A0A1H5PEF7_9ACTN|nr:hypothetical protein [Jiangella alba]SEF12302.1 hypothetical protein SAMN04488561_4217 [Jiangella alba]